MTNLHSTPVDEDEHQEYDQLNDAALFGDMPGEPGDYVLSISRPYSREACSS
ncbi:hypothetical protein [Streptomyces chilikensis]|uniref:hypothetical protein n=1 Tax=Streptomyces chilikensis TaxID=1194079 RepID=UPI000AB826B1|nr:hypothetical protein [Streptomyces chilikensis]